MELKTETRREDREKTERSNIRERERSVWTEEGIEYYHENCKDWICTQEETENLWEEMKTKVKNSIMKIKKKVVTLGSWKLGRKEWKIKKRDLRKELRKMRKGKIRKEEFIRKRKEYRRWCEQEKEKHRREEENKIREIRTEEEAWKYINKFRKKREGIDESIDMEKWEIHFMELLEGTRNKVTLEETLEEREKKKSEENKEEEEKIAKEELIKHQEKTESKTRHGN